MLSMQQRLNAYVNHPLFRDQPLSHPSQPGLTGDTPLHIAVRLGKLGDILAFVVGGCDVNCRGFNGHTPLHDAALTGRYVSALSLLHLGSNIHLVDDCGLTAGDIAFMEGFDELYSLISSFSNQSSSLGNR